jgi:hypothetical protein
VNSAGVLVSSLHRLLRDEEVAGSTPLPNRQNGPDMAHHRPGRCRCWRSAWPRLGDAAICYHYTEAAALHGVFDPWLVAQIVVGSPRPAESERSVRFTWRREPRAAAATAPSTALNNAAISGRSPR